MWHPTLLALQLEMQNAASLYAGKAGSTYRICVFAVQTNWGGIVMLESEWQLGIIIISSLAESLICDISVAGERRQSR